jgi:hypothetical protein
MERCSLVGVFDWDIVASRIVDQTGARFGFEEAVASQKNFFDAGNLDGRSWRRMGLCGVMLAPVLRGL